uniref:Uncharacterized protein n=1 Tax=Neobacillus citreus TaxID=2833578 RepID=A0A942Y945_9BACI
MTRPYAAAGVSTSRNPARFGAVDRTAVHDTARTAPVACGGPQDDSGTVARHGREQ